MRILVQALVAAPGGSLTVLRDLVAAWPDEDELLVVCWRDSAADALTATGRDVVRVSARSTEEALLRLRLLPPAAVRGFDPDVVWSQAVRVGGFNAPQAVHYRDIGSFVSIHPDRLRQRMKNARERHDLNRADLRIFNSAAMRDAVLARHPRVAGLEHTVVHNGLDLAPFEHIDRRTSGSRVAGRPRRILLPQSDAPHKRNWLAADVLAEFRALDSTLRDARLTVAGAGEYADLRATLARHGLEESVEFTGHVPRTEMATLYGNHDAVLMTGRAESFGNPIVEAHAVGLPVVAPPFPAAKELAGPLSRIAADDSATALANELLVALGSSPSPAQIAEARRFAAGFSASMAVDRLRSALLRLLERQRPVDVRTGR